MTTRKKAKPPRDTVSRATVAHPPRPAPRPPVESSRLKYRPPILKRAR